MLFGKRKQDKKRSIRTIEMILDHDGTNWAVFGSDMHLSAPSLEELDRKLEQALEPQLSQEKKLNIFMTTNNEIIPEWMRPFMNHYFNRLLELPLRF